MASDGDDNALRAMRVARTLNQIIGMLHACRCTTEMWMKRSDDPTVKQAYKYSMQMAEGVAFLNMRKLRDLYTFHLEHIMPTTSPNLQRCDALIKECENRKILLLANHLVVHYADNKRELPLP